MRTHRIVAIPGDGIGPELIESALEVLAALQEKREEFRLDVEPHEAGAGHYRKAGRAMSPETLEACRSADATLKGPVGDPTLRLPDGTEAGMLGGILRIGLDLYANVRPIRLFPGVNAPLKLKPGQVDYVVVRENTEGLYASRGLGVGNAWAMADTMLMTRPGVERVCRFAFELARSRRGAPRDGVHRVTCVDKSNVLKSFVFFRQVFTEVGQGYPDVDKHYLYADAAAQALVMEPDRFDVLVLENFRGDILSDLGGGTVGGIGLCPSGNNGDRGAYFEPIHGSAPSLAGKGVANPVSQVLSAAMMLEKLGEREAAAQVEQAVWRALETGALVIGADGCPVGGTKAATRAIVGALGA
ncbi:MAG: isocitrate/isopropylmalate dehydrogenase family protein [Chloroflexi bacterium]|nr:isocitrate/isopropylmalate dehydrogenase family protein [Chloroflexota bacterium]